jgi:hypothetical protein
VTISEDAMKARAIFPTHQRLVALALSVGLVLGLLVMVPDAARADTRVFFDPKGDAGGSGGDFMDFRRLGQSHGDAHRRVRHRIRTQKPWKTSVLGGDNGVTIEITFNTDDDRAWERQIRIRRRDGRLRAHMWRANDDRRLADKVRVWRPNRYSVSVAFSADALKEGVRAYGWRVRWVWRSNRDQPAVVYWDWAPGRGWYRHRL